MLRNDHNQLAQRHSSPRCPPLCLGTDLSGWDEFLPWDPGNLRRSAELRLTLLELYQDLEWDQESEQASRR